MSILRLAIPSPLRRSFDYLPPADMDAAIISTLSPGVRIKAPFGIMDGDGVVHECVSGRFTIDQWPVSFFAEVVNGDNGINFEND